MLIRVKVKAGARKERLIRTVKGVNPGGVDFDRVIAEELVVHVKEKAKENAANDRVRTLVAHHYMVPVRSVRIISGRERPNKIFRVIK